jgi:hypothetical protein
VFCHESPSLIECECAQLLSAWYANPVPPGTFTLVGAALGEEPIDMSCAPPVQSTLTVYAPWFVYAFEP